jgi:DNA-binding MurR/RpiR family transcriptional regulator
MSTSASRAALALEERIVAKRTALTAGEQRVAAFIRGHREDVAFLSVTELAQQLATSDATIVRTAQSLGYTGFPDLKRELIAALKTTRTPALALGRSLDELGDTPGALLDHALGLQIELLQQARRTVRPEAFAEALELLDRAPRILGFAVGPAAHLVHGFVTRLQRIGHDALSISAAGTALADALLTVRPGDALVALAYEPVVAEVDLTLTEAHRRGVPIVLLTDTLAGVFADRISVTLTASRGDFNTFRTLTVAGVLLDTLLLGLAARDRPRSLLALEQLQRLRSRIVGGEAGGAPER